MKGISQKRVLSRFSLYCWYIILLLLGAGGADDSEQLDIRLPDSVGAHPGSQRHADRRAAHPLQHEPPALADRATPLRRGEPL